MHNHDDEASRSAEIINVRARNPHQRIQDDNKRLSDVGLDVLYNNSGDDGDVTYPKNAVKDDKNLNATGRISYGGISGVDEDPQLLYDFDNFYKTTKSLLVLFQVMGVMPIERSALGVTTFR